MEQNPSFSTKVDRKTIEKNRRNHMKALFSQLISLVPHDSREVLSLPDQLEAATNYIKKLQKDLEKKKERKMSRSSSSEDTIGSLKLPQIEVHEKGSVLEVILITGINGQLVFSETIRALHEEGVEVVNASFSTMDNTVFQTIHSKIADSDQPHYVAARISERLKKKIYG